MNKYKEGPWDVIQEWTTKSFERFKVDANAGLARGLAALVTRHEWIGETCHISAFGSEATLTYDKGLVTTKVRLKDVGNLPWFRGKIINDIENTTLDVCGSLSSANKDVFIVHGHNETARSDLKKLLAGLGLRPIILVEQDGLGKTIIEKFEHYARACSFAFVLMTPDDTAGTTSAGKSRWLARPNVIMELGWFMAHLGRDRVAILYTGELEIPSDIHGLEYIEFKEAVMEVADKICQTLKGAQLIQ